LFTRFHHLDSLLLCYWRLNDLKCEKLLKLWC
jgi:hypothetical protein